MRVSFRITDDIRFVMEGFGDEVNDFHKSPITWYLTLAETLSHSNMMGSYDQTVFFWLQRTETRFHVESGFLYNECNWTDVFYG
jgi:hypothetical protein